MKKKAIAVIYSPKSLLDFIWYYSSYGKDYEWDAVVKPYGRDYDKSVLNSMHAYVKKTGIFKNIMIDADNEIFQTVGEKAILFLQMVGYYIVKKQKVFCKKYINKRFKIDDYALVVLTCDTGALEGVVIGVSDEYNVVIFEDGLGDYVVRKEKFDKKDLLNFWNLMGYFLAKMGYGNTHFSSYKLENTKNCEKYATKPSYMKYRDFKSISKLNDMKVCDIKTYKEIMNRIYEIPDITGRVDAVLCTSPLIEFTENKFDYVKAIVEYINKNYSNGTILLKKHPRDIEDYKFDESINVINIDKSVPAELLLTYFSVGVYVFSFPSTILFAMDCDEDNIEVLFFDDIDNSIYKNNFAKSVEIVRLDERNIINMKCRYPDLISRD